MSKQTDALKALGFTEAEIAQIYADDAKVDKMKDSEVNNDLTAEQKKVSKAMRQADRKKDTPPKRVKKEDIDTDKATLIQAFIQSLPEESENLEVIKMTTGFFFEFKGQKYQLKLSKSRS